MRQPHRYKNGDLLPMNTEVGPNASLVPVEVVEDAWQRGYKAILAITFPANSGWFHHENHAPYVEGEHRYFLHPNLAGAESAKVAMSAKYPELTFAVMRVPTKMEVRS